MTEKFIGTIRGTEFFKFSNTIIEDIDTFTTKIDIKGFDKEGNRVFFLRKTSFQHWSGGTTEDFELKQNEGVDLQEFKKTFESLM